MPADVPPALQYAAALAVAGGWLVILLAMLLVRPTRSIALAFLGLMTLIVLLRLRAAWLDSPSTA